MTDTPVFSSEVETPRYEVSIIGGYRDERSISQEITDTLLKVMASSSSEFRLVLAVTGEINTEERGGVAWPLVYGGGVVISSGRVFCGTFASHGPDPDIRSLLTQGVDTLHNIYDADSGDILLQFHPFHILRNPQLWLSQSDDFLLSRLSTSPLVEPPDFCDKMR